MKKSEKAFYQAEERESEVQFSARSLSEELLPLLKEYFYGEFQLEEDAITARFLNGQTFRITIQ